MRHWCQVIENVEPCAVQFRACVGSIYLYSYVQGQQHYITHDDVIKWKHFPQHWPLVWGIHRFPVNSPHKGQWRGALMFSLICDWINAWVNNHEAGEFRHHLTHYDVSVMVMGCWGHWQSYIGTGQHHITALWVLHWGILVIAQVTMR